LVTRSRTVNPKGSWFGRLFRCGPGSGGAGTLLCGGGAAPSKSVPPGKRAFSAATSRLATTPSNAALRAVVPSHTGDGTASNSVALLGSDPGATSIVHV
jgi:hypothetical protein